ncbi:hypothetical protein N9427_10440 [Paracoccaceae bacterium]|nr:hypothetical protein [Paracoccaceae bacterium]
MALIAPALAVGCMQTGGQDLSLASKDFLCANYQFGLQNALFSAKPYTDELKRRGETCDDYKGRADIEIEVK